VPPETVLVPEKAVGCDLVLERGTVWV